MEPERWHLVENLYHAALDCSESERAEFLRRNCNGDESLRREVESLLHYGLRAGKFIETPALELAAESFAEQKLDGRTMLGKEIGHYKLTEKLGSGGMGEVYRALRADDQFQKQVAIKLIRQGYDSDLIIRRFRNERQILASLEHPNIALLLDGGTTDDGLPFFVMELVEGQPIDRYCDSHKLDVTARLKLFRDVCGAVQYAHQNLIVHRDLKPQNILVTEQGVPKLLDFGIGKILGPAQQQFGGDHAVTLLPIMTPDYASPEQVRNEPITTATDVYSLGAILYVLLTGRRPYRVKTSSLDEMVNAICSMEPEKPSTAITHHGDGKSVATDVSYADSTNEQPPEQREKLRRMLAGDLDNIVLKALRKEPGRRYASVDQFSEDIGRYLEGRPVNAGSGTLQYRAGKFIKRHRVAVMAAALLVICAIAGITAIIRAERIARFQQQRAERRFNDVRALANSLMFDVHDAIKDLPGATKARKLLVDRALQYLDSLASDEGNDASLKEELATAYEKVGDVQGDPHGANLGDTTGALASYKKALTIRESLMRAGNNSEIDQQNLASDYHRLGLVQYARGDCRNGLEYFRQSFTIKERILNSKPESRESLAGEYFVMGQCQNQTGDWQGALESYRKSAKMREAIAFPSAAQQANVQTRLAGTYGYMSGEFFNLGDIDQAIEMQTKSMLIMRGLSNGDPGNATYSHYLYEGYYWIGFYQQKKSELVEALDNYQRALIGFEALSIADPAEVRAKHYVGLCYTSIGSVQSALGRSSEGLISIKKGVAILEEARRTDKSGTFVPLPDIAGAYTTLGVAYLRDAERPNISRTVEFDLWNQARSAYQNSLNTWLEAKKMGASESYTRDYPQQAAAEIAKCDAKLAKLNPLKKQKTNQTPSSL